MSREGSRPISRSSRSASAPRDTGGLSAALQLTPCPSIVVDADGLIIASNERFSQATSAPAALLIDQPWWQCFSSQSTQDALEAQRAVVSAVSSSGTLGLPLKQADGLAVQVLLAWQRLREPSSNREVWVFAFFGWYPRDASETHTAPTWRALLHTPSIAGFSALVSNELAGALVTARDAAAPTTALEPFERIASGLREISLSSEGDAANRVGSVVSATVDDVYDPRCGRLLRFIDTSVSQVRRRPADPTRWIAALLVFALERAPADSVVEVSAFDEPGFACVSVRDRGAPLSAEALAEIATSPFDAATALDELGPLPWVRALARANGGTLRAVSEPDGLLVVLSLPAIANE